MENKGLNILIDSGKANTKYGYFNDKGKEIVNSFKTTLQVVEEGDITDFTNKVVIDDVTYNIGNGDYTLDQDNSKLGHSTYVYTAIAKSLNELGLVNEDITLNILVPMAEFKDKELRQKYVDQYLNSDIELTLNGAEYSFKISRVNTFYEGWGASVTHVSATDAESLVIDLGGQNDTYVLFREGKVIADRCTMDNNGVLRMLKRVRTDMSKHGDNWTANQIDNAIEDGNKEVLTALEYRSQEIIDKIRDNIQATNVNHKLVKLVFTGGGATLLEKVIRKSFGEHYAKNQIEIGEMYDNIKGVMEAMKARGI